MSCSLYRQIDFHVHTRLSLCASRQMCLASILDAAAQAGIRYLGITDHIDAYVGPEILNVTRKQLEEIETPIEVFLGCEADILAVGKHVVSEEMRSHLDYVMVSANHFHDPSVAQPRSNSQADVAHHFLEMFRYACSLDFADVIAHPLVVFPGTYDPGCIELIRDEEIAEAVKLARDNGIAMEISPRGLESDQYRFRVRFLSVCKEVGVRFSIGSDAHSLNRIGSTSSLERLLADVGISDSDIWLPSKRGCWASL